MDRDIDELDGRELDKAVAVVLGWNVEPAGRLFRLLDAEAQSHGAVFSEASAWDMIPRYCVNSWTDVIDEIDRRDWDSTIIKTWGYNPVCWIRTDGEENQSGFPDSSAPNDFLGLGETRGEAVCRAFLKAVESVSG